MILAMSKDIRVILVKLADRLHNMRTLDPLPEDKRRLIAQETWTSMLLWPIGWDLLDQAELEDLALRHLDSEAYHDLAAMIDRKRKERGGDIDEAIHLLEAQLVAWTSKRRSPAAQAFYSIYKKMHDQKKELEEIYDLTPFASSPAPSRTAMGRSA